MSGARGRDGAVLLELLIALAIFVGAASVILAATTQVGRGLALARDRQIALEIALSCVAELEAGLTAVERLHDSVVDVAAFSDDEIDVGVGEETIDVDGRWRLEVDTQRSRFEGLSIVTLRVFNARDGSEAAVLRQLVRLGSTGSGGEDFESDPLTEGLDRFMEGGTP